MKTFKIGQKICSKYGNSGIITSIRISKISNKLRYLIKIDSITYIVADEAELISAQ